MAYAKVEADIVIEGLMQVFRSVGYDGASLAELASATGLKKASLYHRFPGGKEEMANVVLDHVSASAESQIFENLLAQNPAAERLDAALYAVYNLYEGGRSACILRAMSHGTAAGIFREKVADIFEKWVSAFTHLATDLGHDTETAKRLGASAVMKIQGSLILAQTLNQPELFSDALSDIKKDFLK